MNKPKGFIPYGDRPACEDCKYFKIIGSGSPSQRERVCTNVEPYYPVMPDDVCDDFDKL